MDALVMCGGQGTRFDGNREKPLHPIDGDTMVDHVRWALERAGKIEDVYAAVSPNAPETRAHLEAVEAVETIRTDGEGYVSDLLAALERTQISKPVLTVAADLPALEGVVIDHVLERHGSASSSLTVCVPVALKRRLGVGVDTTLENAPHLVPTGVNVVGTADEAMRQIHYDPRLAVNVNRLTDATVAEQVRATADGDPR